VAAPKSMKSFVTACWLLTVFFGNFINIPITGMYNDVLPPLTFFAMLTGMMVVVCIVFFFVARWFNRASAKWMAEQSQEVESEAELAPQATAAQ
jgi:dipeptide/tripeptide permease